MSASMTRPVRHNVPSQLSIVARHIRGPHAGELIPCAFVWHDPGITPCCKTILSMWVIDSRSRTAKQLRFKSALVPIRLFQNPIPQLLYGDFCNTIGTQCTSREPLFTSEPEW